MKDRTDLTISTDHSSNFVSWIRYLAWITHLP